MKKYRLKKQYRRAFKKCSQFFKLILFVILLIFIFNILFNNYIEEVTYKDGKVIINLSKDNLSCILSIDEPTIDDNWINSENKVCVLDYTFGSNIYIKKNNKIIDGSKKELYYFDVKDKDTIYVAVNGEYQYISTLLGNEKKIKISIVNPDIISVSTTGLIKGLKEGSTLLTISYDDISYNVNVVVTNLITSNILKDDYNFDKPELECEEYTKDENDLLDKILKDRINDAGYKTRAGAVEAARFLVLEFPYKLSYFYENGRQTTNNVDGEGRYYHVGLYLNESKFSSLTGSATGPEVWGCPLYSNPAHRYIDNGLDCSGYVSWALLNAGFDVKDVGAGFSTPLDLTDYGDVKEFTTSLINANQIKVGDLVHSEHSGGHIGMIIGIDSEYFYIAQALWNDADQKLTKKDPNVMAVQITKYTYDEIQSIFPHVVLMDKYYLEDGNLTEMW